MQSVERLQQQLLLVERYADAQAVAELFRLTAPILCPFSRACKDGARFDANSKLLARNAVKLLGRRDHPAPYPSPYVKSTSAL
jgi:hypothetical protein